MSFREVSFGFGPAGSFISGAITSAVGVPLALRTDGGLSMVVLLGVLVAVPHTRRRTQMVRSIDGFGVFISPLSFKNVIKARCCYPASTVAET